MVIQLKDSIKIKSTQETWYFEENKISYKTIYKWCISFDDYLNGSSMPRYIKCKRRRQTMVALETLNQERVIHHFGLKH